MNKTKLVTFYTIKITEKVKFQILTKLSPLPSETIRVYENWLVVLCDNSNLTLFCSYIVA